MFSEDVDLESAIRGFEDLRPSLKGAMIEFRSFLKDWDEAESRINAILVDPEHASIPGRIPELVATVFSLVNMADTYTFKAIFQYLGRLTPEYTATFVNELRRVEPGLLVTPEFESANTK